MADWIFGSIALVISLVGLYTGYRVADAVNRRRWTEMDRTISAFTGFHDQHFKHAKKAEADMARVQQQVSDHEREDEKRFDRIEAMFREIRDALRDGT